MIDDLTLKQCRMRATIHLNGGGAWFGWVYVCVEHPRLRRIDRCDRKTKKVTIQYQVDGENVGSLAEAAARLNEPPAVTDQMREDLVTIGHEFGDHRKSIGYVRLKALDVRGLIEWGERGQCRVRREEAV